ncbi:MAG: M60 family metallopeptidase [Candidatus Symbiothrix sp.]|jgi:hypothetical protein|nr:M60 family metallopeptidase [Candidatus Symbiothrix sp.]
MKNKSFLIFLLGLMIAGKTLAVDIVTPYPDTILLKQINGAEKERLRLCQGHRKFDQQPTGFYLERGKKVKVKVEILTPALDGSMPELTVGTLGFNVAGRAKKTVALKEGINTIVADQDTLGGLIYLSFTTNAKRAPQGEARIIFTEESEQVRAPHYIYGVTTVADFRNMLDTYPTPDVIFHSDYVIVCATREAANQYSRGINQKKWLDGLHTLLALEDTISGMDNNDPNPIHHRMNTGEIRFLLTENTSGNPHANTAGYTGYPHGSIRRYLTEFTQPGGGNDIWMLGHELGHQHQQPAYQINLATESTVNIYTFVVERNIVGPDYVRTSNATWAKVRNTYLAQPVENRKYDTNDTDMKALVGIDGNEVRFLVWEQLFCLFGDSFYKTLHRVVREEKVSAGGTSDERIFYLIWKASQISGYDLREYFNQWGIRVTGTLLKRQQETNFTQALASTKIIPLPQSIETILSITGATAVSATKPSWLPLPIRGITSSAPAEEALEKTNWTITTSINGVPDTVVGGDSENYIIDDNRVNAFAFIKPGLTYGGVSGPADYIPSFTINLHQPESFNYFTWHHRSSNTYPYLRANKVSLYGSHTGNENDFVPVQENLVLDVTKNDVQVALPATVTYQYVKVVITGWDTSSGSTIQVSEFDLGIISKGDETAISSIKKPQAAIHVYPNPAHSGQTFYVQTGDERKGDKLSIYSLTGQKVWEQTLVEPVNAVNVSVPAGIYLLKIGGGVHPLTTKLRINR